MGLEEHLDREDVPADVKEAIKGEITKHHLTEATLRESESNLSQIFNTVSDSILFIRIEADDCYRVIKVNQAFLTDTGFTEEQVVDKRVDEILPKSVYSSLVEKYNEAIRTGKPVRSLDIVDLPKGARRYFNVTITPIFDEKGNCSHLLGVAEDITEQKQAEEKIKGYAENLEQIIELRTLELQTSEKRYRGLYESSKDGFVSADSDGNIMECNQAFADMLDYTKEELYRLNYKEITPNKWYAMEEKIHAEQTVPQGYSGEYEKELIKKDGTIIPISIRIWLIKDEDGKTYGSWAIIRDITERKRAEEALKESEEMYSTIVEQGNDGIAVVQDGFVEYVNQKLVEITGFSVEEALGKSFFAFIAPEYRELVVNRYQTRMSGEGVPDSYEIEILSKYGGKIPVEINASVIEYKDKPADIAIIRDITDRKRLERQLVESERKYRTLVENDPNIIFFIEGRVLKFVNQTFLDTLGFSREELYAPTFDFFANIIPEQREMIRELLTEIYTGEDVLGSFELSLITKKGEIVPCLANLTSFEMEGKQVIQGVLTDIRIIEELQKELKESEMHYRGLYESSLDGIVSFDLQRNILECNQAFADMHGYTKEELRKMTLWDVIDEKWHFIPEKIRTEQILTRGYSDVFEAENVKKDGTAFPVSVRTWLIKDEEGRSGELWGIVRDITERKRIEEELQETQKRLEDAMQTGNLAWWDMDCSTGKVIFNELKVRILGYTPEEFTDAHYTDFTDLVHPEDHELTMQAMRDHLDGKKPNYEVEYRIRTKSGGWKWFYDVGGITERDKDGKPLRVTGVVQDITERKRAEDALKMVTFNLRERIKELRSLYGISQLVDKPGISFEETLQGIIELIPSSWQYPEIACARIILKDQEFVTENFRETLWKQTSDIIVHGNRIGALEVYYLEKMPESDEGPFLKEERNLIDAIAERVGKIITRIQTEEQLKDYTENLEKIVEERTKDLKKSEERLKAILTGMADFVTIQNKDLDIIWMNQAVKDIWGNVIGKKCYEVYRGFDSCCPDCTVEKVFTEGKTLVSEGTIVKPDGTQVHIMTTSSPVRDAEGNIVAAVEVVKDITERKRAEEALQKSESRLAEAQRIAHLGNWDWNIQTNELHWSDEIYRIFGLTPQEFGATYDAFLNSVHPEDREYVKQSVDEALYERKPYSIDHRIILPDGEVRMVHEQAEVTFDETGRPIRMMGTVLDITERKKLELQLIESEKRYRGLYESSIDGILSVNMDNQIIESNQALAEMLGYTKDELSKLSTSDITSSKYHDMVAELITEQVIKRGHSDEFETKLLKKDGTLISVSARIWLIQDKEGIPKELGVSFAKSRSANCQKRR